MTYTHDYYHLPHVFIPDTTNTTMKLASSASEQNVYFTYVCLVSEIKPNENIDPECGFNRSSHQCGNVLNEEITHEDEHIQVERSKALHELVESHRKTEKNQNDNVETDSSTPYPATTSGDDSEVSENDCNFISYDNPNILKLTKMKWLTEEQDGGPDSSSPSISPTTSSISSICSKESEDDLSKQNSFGDKYLSTILRLDREHNMFGLSNIAIVGTKASKLKRREDDRAIFHQTAIVQVCCAKKCCRHKSNTDLPASLKCSGCRGCCADPGCALCSGPCGPPDDPPCSPFCTSCPRGKCICKASCIPPKCSVDCNKCFGLKVSLNRKTNYEPTPIELTPRSSSVLQKPMAARSCHHLPQCVPPSSCFPYLMPCFWPARSSAPCSVPTRCFHNPPCPPPRKHQCPLPPEVLCPRNRKCEDESKKTKCTNDSCLGSIDQNGTGNEIWKEINMVLPKADGHQSCSCAKAKSKSKVPEACHVDGKKTKKKKQNKITCECAVPTCVSCFVSRPEKRNQTEDSADMTVDEIKT